MICLLPVHTDVATTDPGYAPRVLLFSEPQLHLLAPFLYFHCTSATLTPFHFHVFNNCQRHPSARKYISPSVHLVSMCAPSNTAWGCGLRQDADPRCLLQGAESLGPTLPKQLCLECCAASQVPHRVFLWSCSSSRSEKSQSVL